METTVGGVCRGREKGGGGGGDGGGRRERVNGMRVVRSRRGQRDIRWRGVKKWKHWGCKKGEKRKFQRYMTFGLPSPL